MNPRGDEPRQRGALTGRTSVLQEKIAQFYYAHGLFCSSYPGTLVSLAICVTLICCYPLLSLPLPGNAPLQTWTVGVNSSSGGQPFCYIQQVVLRTAVLPWEADLALGDAFRAPLYEAFKLLEIVRNYQDEGTTLGHLCLHVEAVRTVLRGSYKNYLPQYSCLVLSPANLWQQDVQKFSQDSSLLNTIFHNHNLQKGKTSLAEMLFGMKMVDTGMKRYPLRNRKRVVQYAITLFFKDYDDKFMKGLRHKLQTMYPLHQSIGNESEASKNDTLIIQYPGEINFVEFIPITVAFFLLFLYFYFSIRKIELIHSKLTMAFCSVTTVCASLTMSYGVCFFFGLTLNLESKVVFPYFVLLVGLENVLCLTKSVVSTPLHLDVKIRIAQGLCKEGWSITKNLLLELTILTFGIFTFVPVIQEFCIFAIVGLLADFFMQMVFFSTVLGMDIRKRENLVEKNNPNFRSSLYQIQVFYDRAFSNSKSLARSKSHPRLSSFPNLLAGAQNVQEKKIPKRLKLVNIWTRTRFFHRSFMILMVIWISNIAYNSGFIEHYILNNRYFHEKDIQNRSVHQNYSTIKLFPLLNTNNSINVNYVTQNPVGIRYKKNQTNDLYVLKHTDYSPMMKLSAMHWNSIVKRYNMSLSGQYVAILPAIKISHAIRPEQAAVLRNPDEKYGEKFEWQALAAALDPLDFLSGDSEVSKNLPQWEQPFYPTSVFAMTLITILCIISVVVLLYIFIVLYRCICSRNYAEWRASWFSEKTEEAVEDQVLLEAVPVVLDGHPQEVEWIATDGASLVSSCLDGQLKIWDASTGELLSTIDRKAHFYDEFQTPSSASDDNSSDYESGSPPFSASLFPHLKHRINTNFANVKDFSRSNSYDAKKDFSKTYRELYFARDFPKTRIRKDSKKAKDKRLSFSENRASLESVGDNNQTNNLSESDSHGGCRISPIWCVDYVDNLIAIGCADGRLEFWEGTTGRLKCIFEDGTNVGINSVKIVGSRVVATRLYGTLDLFKLQTYSHGHPVDWNFTCAYKRTHVRTGSFGSAPTSIVTESDSSAEDLRCLKIVSLKAHQQPITCLDCEGGRIVTGSQDHTLKVFRLDDGSPQYTLHGHCGPVTCLFIDRVNPTTAGSGSQDGMLCVWDLLTGACMYNLQAHDGTVTSLTYSASYVISLGSDDRICVWERFQGHILNTIYVSQTFSSQVLMLTPHLVVTARSGGLVIWDVRSGECVRTIPLGRSPYVFIKQIILLRDAVLCDYGKQLRIVRFPLITHKFD